MSELDEPEGDEYECVMPFVVCKSRNGPFEDEAFSAGFACGSIDAELAALAAAGGVESRTYSVPPEVLPQLDLLGMRRGFPITDIKILEEYPDWATVVFRVSGAE